MSLCGAQLGRPWHRRRPILEICCRPGRPGDSMPAGLPREEVRVDGKRVTVLVTGW